MPSMSLIFGVNTGDGGKGESGREIVWILRRILDVIKATSSSDELFIFLSRLRVVFRGISPNGSDASNEGTRGTLNGSRSMEGW